MGNSRVWIIVGVVAIVALGGWFFMSGDNAAEGVVDEPTSIEEADSVEDQDTDEDDDGDE